MEYTLFSKQDQIDSLKGQILQSESDYFNHSIKESVLRAVGENVKADEYADLATAAETLRDVAASALADVEADER